jgi:transcription antitermination factor NusA-like protein
LLTRRFEKVSKELKKQIELIEDIETLDKLIDKAITVASLEEFLVNFK